MNYTVRLSGVGGALINSPPERGRFKNKKIKSRQPVEIDFHLNVN